ncbi:MAG: hypothetical protein PGN34_18360 [Methylobacterium frigidaeris]
MTALIADRSTRARSGTTREMPVKAGVLIYAGAIVALDANGMASPGITATGLTVLGRATGRADNRTGADGAKRVNVEKGVSCYVNSPGIHAVTNADIGKSCYVVDDCTVAKIDGSGTRSIAGKIFEVDATGVWVEMG